jgi:predicted MFS family arabinose efflux permease
VALLGQVPSLTMLLAGLIGLFVGPLADRFGSGQMLRCALLAVAASALATGLAPSLPMLLAVTLVGAVGRAAILPVSQAVVATRFTDAAARRRALSRVHMGRSTASILGVPLLTSIAAVLYWRGAFFALAATALAVALVLRQVLPPDGPARGARPKLGAVLASYAPLLRHPPSLGIIGGAMIGNAGIWIVVLYLAAYFSEQHGFTTQQTGWAYLATGLALFLGQLAAGGRLGARPRPLVLASHILSGLFLGAAVMLPLPAIAALCLMALGMASHGLNLIGTAIVLSSETPTARVTALTINSSGMSVGAALGGALGGLALAFGGYAALGPCALALALAAAGLVGWSGMLVRAPAVPATVES